MSIKNDAHAWFLKIEAQPIATIIAQKVTFEGVKQALMARFQNHEDPSVVYHMLKALKQSKCESVMDFVQQFEDLWKRWCASLGVERPPLMIRKSSLLTS